MNKKSKSSDIFRCGHTGIKFYKNAMSIFGYETYRCTDKT